MDDCYFVYYNSCHGRHIHFFRVKAYTPEMKEFAMSIIPISNDIKEFFKNISLGFFTGAAVTGGIAISDYRIERRNTLIEFENASFEFLQNFRNLVYYIY